MANDFGLDKPYYIDYNTPVTFQDADRNAASQADLFNIFDKSRENFDVAYRDKLNSSNLNDIIPDISLTNINKENTTTLPPGMSLSIFNDEKKANCNFSYENKSITLGSDDRTVNFYTDYNSNENATGKSEQGDLNASLKDVVNDNLIVFGKVENAYSNEQGLTSTYNISNSILAGTNINNSSINTALSLTAEKKINNTLNLDSTNYKAQAVVEVLKPLNEQSTFQGAVYCGTVQGTDKELNFGACVGILPEDSKDNSTKLNFSYEESRTQDYTTQEYNLTLNKDKLQLSAYKEQKTNSNPVTGLNMNVKSLNQNFSIGFEDNGANKTYKVGMGLNAFKGKLNLGYSQTGEDKIYEAAYECGL